MPYLTEIQHPDKKIADKVSYFVNYFALSNTHVGKLQRFPFNTPAYALNLIYYQLLNNKIKCGPYVLNYLKSLSGNDLDLIEVILDSKVKFDRLKKIISHTDKELFKELKARYTSLLRYFKNISESIQAGELSKVVEIITNLLQCQHELIEHQSSLEYLANLLVVRFRLEGFNKAETKKGLKNIFSNELQSFPFPSYLNEINEKEKRLELKEDFLKHRTFNQQFGAITDAVLKEKYSPYYIFRISNVHPESDEIVDFNFKDSRIISQNHSLAIEIRELTSMDTLMEDFFDKPSFLLVIFKMDVNSETFEVYNDISKRLNEISNYINLRLSESYAHPNLSAYLTTIDFKEFSTGFKSVAKIGKIENYHNDQLLDNAFEHLAKSNDKLKAKLLHFEGLYWESVIERDLVKMWSYLENLTPAVPGEGRSVRKVVSNILLYGYKGFVKAYYLNDFKNIISTMSEFGGGSYRLEEGLKKFRKMNIYEVDLFAASRISGNLFIKRLGVIFKEDQTRLAHSEYRNFINSTLLESYSYRNMAIHTGFYNKNLELKLHQSLLIIVTQFRRICIGLIRDNPNRKNFDKLLMYKVNRKL